ncbi:ABC transporter substrate-binding protein [Thermodesulforhabdus norvegica]|uniref:Amino acid/amide ABC transporter substrate-binding protein, HAAT family n=1 Tax=Thermodesulforhabdus norvegica TaxID=39841 RepID=A0A1I4U033_9BACT|nr:ABC transporter substrate-binding protein [Thermodesulforhabdus norvegica]SFM82083.1 amino acid/amide ABC transporter substrate-binding protein, HAAT family [Thermodesulforhabdus norvegica]
MKKKILVLVALLGFFVAVGIRDHCAAEEKASIKIGAFFALSGPASSIGTPTKLVAQMAVDKINKEGGIDGHPLELVFGDTESDPTKALIVAKRLVEQEKVIALIGPTRTDTGMAVKPYIEQSGIPTVMTVGGDPVIAGGKFGPYRWTFKAPQRTSVAVKKIYGYLQKRGIKKIALIHATDGFGRDGLRWLRELAPEYGLQIVAVESFGVNDPDMTAQLVKIKNTDAEALICWTIGPAGAKVARNVRQLDITIPLIQCHGLPDPKYVELAGDAANGSIMPSTRLMVADQLPDTDPQKPVVKEFMRLYEEEYNFDEKYPINTHSGYAWDAIMLLTEAIKRVGPDKMKDVRQFREAIRDALENIDGYVGISGIFHLTPEDHNGLGTDSLVMVQVVDGGWKLIEP